jgi:hypothetical protein
MRASSVVVNGKAADMIGKSIVAGAAASLATVGGASATTHDYTTLNVPDTLYTYGLGINDSGAVTGSDSGNGSGDGYVYSGGAYATIEFPGSGGAQPYAINDSGAVTGDLGSDSFLYSGGTGGAYAKIKYPGSTSTDATGINASSVVAGYYTRGSNALVTGFEDLGGTYTRIKYPKSADTWVWGINTAGAAAGYYENSSGDPA